MLDAREHSTKERRDACDALEQEAEKISRKEQHTEHKQPI